MTELSKIFVTWLFDFILDEYIFDPLPQQPVSWANLMKYLFQL